MVELLHGWKVDPNTLAWLKTLPGFNELRNVDKETTAALGAPLEDDSGTINWLEELAHSKVLADTDLVEPEMKGALTLVAGRSRHRQRYSFISASSNAKISA